MSQIINFIKALAYTAFSLVITAIEPHWNTLVALGICMSVDFIMGLWHSYSMGNKFSPKKLKNKLLEVIIFLLGLVAVVALEPIWANFAIASLFMINTYIGAYAIYHLVSFLQNAGKMGFPISGFIQKMIESKTQVDLSTLKKEEVINENKK